MSQELKQKIKEIIGGGFTYYLGVREDTSFDCKPLIEYIEPRILELFEQEIKKIIPKELPLKEKTGKKEKEILKKVCGDTKTPIWMKERRFGFNLCLNKIKENIKKQGLK